MVLRIDIAVDGPVRPPAGAPVIVQVRDTSLADAAAPLVAEARSAVVAGQPTLASVVLDLPDAIDPRSRLDVFVHVDVDADAALSSGDFITTQAHPVPLGQPEVRLAVAVQPI